MPTNIGSESLSALKIGESAVSKAYVGISQIFPNNTEITAAAFDDATIANTGGNTPYTVSGEIGSAFTLTGSTGATAPSGTQVISTSPTTYQIAIDDQSTTCGALARNSQVLITPQGSTTLASGLSNTDTIIQSAGPATTNFASTISLSVTNTNYQTVTVGGTLYWAAGASWDINASWSGIPAGANPKFLMSAFGSGTWGGDGSGPFSGSSGTAASTWTMTSAQLSLVSFRGYSTGLPACYNDTGSPSAYNPLYP